MSSDPRKRFSARAGYYAKFRPSYPDEIILYLKRELVLSQESVVVDVGSGTGILSEMFLKNGNTVFGVEPNQDMRTMAETRLSNFARFRSINGSAEHTTLQDGSVDFITAGQSFHWFDPSRAKVEFRRILRTNGWVVLVWNTRKTTSPFLQAYDQLLKAAGLAKRRVAHEDLNDAALRSFLGNYREVKLSNIQDLDYEGLVGRFLSASYAPLPGEPNHEEVVAGLHEIYEKHQSGGHVRFEYETELYAGQLS